MTAPTALPSNGFFVQLMPMLAERTLMLIVSRVDDQHLTLSVVPKRMKEGENTALTTPLCCSGTPDELDRDLPAQLRDFVAGYLALSNNLAQIQHEREEAERVAREELKKRQKTAGNGGSKAKAAESQPRPEENVIPAAPAQSTMNLFDSSAESSAEAGVSRTVGRAPVPDEGHGRRTTTTVEVSDENRADAS